MIIPQGAEAYRNPGNNDLEVRIRDRKRVVRYSMPGSPARVLVYLNDECGAFGDDARPIIAAHFTINEDLTRASVDYWVTDIGAFEFRGDHWVFIPDLSLEEG